jgi:hypothetical protein
MTPIHSDAIADSIGLCLHPEANAYRDTKVWPLLVTNLIAAKVRRGRIGAGVIPSAVKTASTAEYLGRVNWLAQIGMKMSVVMQQNQTDPLQIEKHFIQAGGNWEFVEASNEPNMVSNWGPGVAAYQQVLWNAVQTSDLMQEYGVKVAGPGLTGTGIGTHACGDLSPYVDYGNWHPYNNGLAPEHVVMDQYITDAQAVYGSKPLLATEFGLTTSLGQTRIQAVSDDVAVCYLPRQFLTNYAKGFVKSYWHQAIQDHSPNNSDPQAGYGLINIDGSLSYKWNQLRTLITRFNDPGTEYIPTDVDVTVTGGDADLRVMLFQKRDGTNQLCLWLAKPIWDNVNYNPIVVPTQPITITLPAGKTTAKQFNFGAKDASTGIRTGILSPAAGTTYTANVDNQITMNVGPDLLVIEF